MKRKKILEIYFMAFVLFSSSLFFTSCSVNSGDSENETDNNNNMFSVSGTVVDDNDVALAGVRVTGGGVEAQDLSDKEGKFTISSPFEFENNVVLTASNPGYDSYFSGAAETPNEVVRSAKSALKIRMTRQSRPGILSILNPAENTTVGLDDNCTAEVDINGVVNFKERKNFLIDVIFLIDASGSTESLVQGNQTVFDIELKAVKKFLKKFNHKVTRVGVVRFATEAVTMKSLTSDLDSVGEIIDEMKAEGPEPLGQSQSGTNFYNAVSKALNEFENSPFTIQSSDADVSVTLEPQKLVVMVSDGIPTLPEKPGISQQVEDLDAALNAAIEAKDQGVIVYTYAVGLDEEDKRMSALPAISDITEGKYFEVTNMKNLEFVMPEQSLVGMGTLYIKNLTNNSTVEVTPNSEGLFSSTIPVSYGPQTIKIVAFDFHDFDSISKEIQIEGILTSESGDEPWGLSDTSITSASDIKTPSGESINDDDLYNLFIAEKAEYPDITETIGTEIFIVPGTPGEDVTVSGSLIFKHACYVNDIGYLVVDPLDPVGTTTQAFEDATEDNVLINTSAIGRSCNAIYSNPGEAEVSFSFTVTGGSNLVFFMIPNGTLSEAQSGNKQVLYTVSSLNPGGFDQVLSYYSANGRRNAGTPHCILSFEDISLIYKSDSDYGDIVFNIEGVLPWRISNQCQN